MLCFNIVLFHTSCFFCPTQYVFVVMAVLVLEAGVGALARLYEEQVGPELKMNLNRTFLENYSVRSRETAAIDQMQKEVSTPSFQKEFRTHFSNRLHLVVLCFKKKRHPALSNNCDQNKVKRRVSISLPFLTFSLSLSFSLYS